MKSEYVQRFFKRPWEEESDGCRQCFLALFANATLNALKLNTGESFTFGRFGKEVTPAIKGLILAMLEVQGHSIIKLPSNAKTPNMDSNKAEVNRHRMEALYRRISIKQHFSRDSTPSMASSIPTVDTIRTEKRKRANIAHQWYIKAVEKINDLRDQVNNKKRKRDSDSVGASLEGQNEPRIRIENPPGAFAEQGWINMENPDMSDIGDVEQV